MNLCKLCHSYTTSMYRIKKQAVPICTDCGRSIFIQQANFFIETEIGGKYVSMEDFMRWLRNCSVSVKLSRALEGFSGDTSLISVEKVDIMSSKYVGEKTWSEFCELRQQYLNQFK